MEIGYIGITFFVLLLVFAFYLVFKKKARDQKEFSNLGLLGIALVVVSMFFNEISQPIGYVIMGSGVIVAVIGAFEEKKEE